MSEKLEAESLKDWSDEELMRLYRDQGDERAFAELYQRHSGRIYSYLSNRLNYRHETDELHQAVFLKFHQSRRQYDPQYPVLQWLFVISKTALVDHARKLKRAVPLTEGADPEKIQAETPVNSDFDLAVMQKLSEKERAIVELRVFDELSYQQISEKLGKTEANVRQIVSRALRKLRVLIEAKGSVQ